MAWEKPLELQSFEAAADLSAHQYHFVKVDSTGKTAPAGAGENAIGVLQNKPTAGQTASVMDLGVSKVVLGGSVTAGDNLAANAASKAVTAVGTAAAIAVALEGGVSGDVIPALLVTRVSAGGRTSSVLHIPIKLAKVAVGDVVTNFVPGFAGLIKKVSFLVTDPATTALKLATLNLEIGTTNVTGGVVSLTSANCTPLGNVVAGTAVTANNAFSDTDAISVEAAAVTAFVEGEGVLLITLG